MKITKFGHSCFLIEENDVRILFDPGNYSNLQDGVQNLDIILITHQHADHCDPQSIKNILKNNPSVKIFTNSGVGAVLNKEKIDYKILEEGGSIVYKDVLIEAFGNKHAIIYYAVAQIQNTGYFINNKFFYPGDNFINPGKPVPVLALPVAAPWLKISETVDYAQLIQPQIWLAAHDGMLNNQEVNEHRHDGFIDPMGIKFVKLKIGQEIEI